MKEMLAIVIWLGPALWLKLEYQIGWFTAFVVLGVSGCVAFFVYGWLSMGGLKGFRKMDAAYEENQMRPDYISNLQKLISGTQISVRDSIPHLRLMLRNGGMAEIYVPGEKRQLTYVPAVDSPRVRLPWPLSIFQDRSCSLRVYDWTRFQGAFSTTTSEEFQAMRDTPQKYFRLFKKAEVHVAIAQFLEGASPDGTVSFFSS